MKLFVVLAAFLAFSLSEEIVETEVTANLDLDPADSDDVAVFRSGTDTVPNANYPKPQSPWNNFQQNIPAQNAWNNYNPAGDISKPINNWNNPSPNNWPNPINNNNNWPNPINNNNNWQNPINNNNWQNPAGNWPPKGNDAQNPWVNPTNNLPSNPWNPPSIPQNWNQGVPSGVQNDPPQESWTTPKNPTQNTQSKPAQNQNQQTWQQPASSQNTQAKPVQNQNQQIWQQPASSQNTQAKPVQNQNQQTWQQPAKPAQNQNQQTWNQPAKPPQNNWNQNQNWNQPQAPSTTTQTSVIKNEQFFGENGSYKYEYQIADGTSVGEEGYVLNPNTEDENVVKKGWYSYLGADGKTYTVTYWADKTGYHAFGDHLPKAPQVPAPTKPNQENKPQVYPQQKPQNTQTWQKPMTQTQTYYPQQQQQPAAAQPTKPSYTQQTYYPGSYRK